VRSSAMARRFFVTGTDTDVGKTVLSALLCAALDAFYWKPIQTGACEGTDRQTVMRLARLREHKSLPESYCFDPPVSPHLAALQAGRQIELTKIHLPQIPATDVLVVEGAGGVMVPINETELMTDLMRHLRFPVLLASRSTLGTINHTLLSVAALRRACLAITGVVMIGPENADNFRAIERYGSVPVVGVIPQLDPLHRDALLQVFRSKFDPQVFAA
jgi:dethiobiotin synthetase